MTEQLLELLPPEIVNKIDDHLIENYRRSNAKKCSEMMKRVEVKTTERSTVITAEDNITMYGTCPYCLATLSLKQIQRPVLTIHNHWSPVCEGSIWERQQDFYSQPTSYTHMTSWTLNFEKMNEEDE